MPIAIVAYTADGDTTSAVTTDAINTTGATLIVIAAATYYYTPSGSYLSDSAGNTWTPLTVYGPTDQRRILLFYCANPTTSASHTFSYSAASYIALSVAAFSGTASASVLDSESGGADSTPGPLTPTQNNCLVVAAACYGSTGSGSYSLDDGFTEAGEILHGGAYVGCLLGYKIQTTAASASPAFSPSDAVPDATAIAAFRAVAAGHPAIKRFGGVPFAALNKGVW